MSKLSNRTAALGIMSALALGTIASLPAHAQSGSGSGGGDGEVRVAGACTAASSSKLKVKHDDGRIEAQFEVDSNRVGQRWNVVMKDNGVIVFSGVRTTLAPSGSFEVERRIPNRAGTDTIVASAKNPTTGESCVARAAI
jgi:hypothetical protein